MFIETIGHYVHFALFSLAAAGAAFLRPRDLLRQLYVILVGALPLAAVAGLALGIVTWLHLRHVLPGEYAHLLPRYLSLAVVLEFAPLGAGLIIAGRTGASLGAELGSMRITEQIDALELLGQSPMRVLVGPRVLACILTLPLLTVLIGFLAIGGSYLSEVVGGNMTPLRYREEVLHDLTLAKVIPANLKTTVFGFLVGVTGCFFGMRAAEGTEAVGRAATQGVVVSTFLVLIANVILVRVIQVLVP